jgi:transketolase
MESPRDGFGRGMVQAAQQNPRVLALCADLTESIRLEMFREQFPERFVEIGVAEQNLAGVAAGMALTGAIPFACSFAVFNPGRNWDQIRVSICYAQANVKIIGAHAGLATGADGATHQALEDIAMMRVLPHMTVIVPTDAVEAEKAVHFAVQHEGPVYIRFGREKVPTLTNADSSFEYGKAVLLRRGTDVTLCACGPLVGEALKAAETLAAENIHAAVIAVPFVKPLDEQLLLDLAQTTGAFVTAEDAQVDGGLGSAITEFLAEHYPIPVQRIGVKSLFGQSGTAAELYKAYGLTDQDIVQAAKESMKRKRQHI